MHLPGDNVLSHWDRITHICVNKIYHNGWSPVQHQAITWIIIHLLLTEPSGTKFSERGIKMQNFYWKKKCIWKCCLLQAAIFVQASMYQVALRLHICDLALLYIYRADSRFAPSQWEAVLLCNDISYWLSAKLESALYMCENTISVLLCCLCFIYNKLCIFFLGQKKAYSWVLL